MRKSILCLMTAITLLMTACGAAAPAPPVTAPAETPAASISEELPQEPQSEASSQEAPAEPSEEEDAAEPVDEELSPETDMPMAALNIAAPKGPTSMGMAQLMNDNGEGGKYHFTLVGSPDELVGGIVQGEYDIAAVPVNLAANLYHKTQGGVKIAALNTLGVLYIVEAGDTVQSVEDLRGRTIYATGQGSTPEYALNYILEQNGLVPGQDVTVEYKTEHAELASLLAAGKADLAMLPQPFVTSALEQNQDLRVALDLTEEWDKAADDGSQLTMGCIIVQSSLAEEAPEVLDEFLRDYRNSINFVKEPENAVIAAGMMERFDILKASVAEKALPQCNLTFVRGDKMKEIAEGFLQVLYAADAKSVGGELPDGGFYYGASE